MKIKVCGLKEPENILAVAGLNPDYVGFIRYAKSQRFSEELPADILKQLTPDIIKTGVFVNESIDAINSLIKQYELGAVQLHGDETPKFCSEFKGKVEVLKAFGVDENFDFEALNDYAHSVDYFLFDTKTAAHGGSGKSFNWALLDNYRLDIPFFLSGGLSLENLEEIKNIKHPAFYGVDLNSRFETAPGLKDIDKLKQAFAMLHTTTNEIRS